MWPLLLLTLMKFWKQIDCCFGKKYLNSLGMVLVVVVEPSNWLDPRSKMDSLGGVDCTKDT